MKKYILSLFSTTNRLWTISFLFTALVLIITSLSMGMRNNLPMNVMFVFGIGFLYLALIHIWRKSKSYFYLSAVSFGVFLLLFIIVLIVSNINFSPELPSPSKVHTIVGGLYTIIGLCLCIPGIIIGLLGSLLLSYRENRVIKA